MTELIKTPRSAIEAPDGVIVEIDVSTERWSEFNFSDGTVLRAKVTIASAKRIKNAFDEEGRPMYALQAAFNTVLVKVPEELMKPKS